MVFGIVIFLLLVLSVWRRYHIRYSAVKFKYEIYRLRDKLRMLALNKDIDPNSWIFDFFDNSFSKAIRERYYITLSHLLMLTFVHENEDNIDQFSDKLDKELGANKALMELHSEYLLAIRRYVRDQHYVSFNFILKPIAVLVFGAATTASRFNSWLRSVLIYPEISDSSRFAMK